MAVFTRVRARRPHSRIEASNLVWWAFSRVWLRWVRRDFHAIGIGVSILRPVLVFGAENISIGDYVQIGPMCRFGALNGATVSIGSGTEITGGSTLFAQAEPIEIGRGVLMAWNVQIFDTHHATNDRTIPIREQGLDRAGRVVVKDGAWLGANVVVFPGVTIGRNAVVGANSVVTRDVPDFAVVAGAPARPTG